MTLEEIMDIIDRSLYAEMGYIDDAGRPAVCRFYCVWHRGIGRHLVSTQTRFKHSQCLMEGRDACLYFGDEETCANVCLSGRAVVTYEHDKKAMLWYEGDERYFPEGIDDRRYCVIEFTADGLNYYREDGKGTIDGSAIAAFDAGREYENGYGRTHPGPERKLTVGSVVWGVTDVPRAVAFWKAALDYELKGEPTEGWAMLVPKDGQGIRLSLNRVTSPKPRRHHIDLFTDDRAREVERLLALGARRKAWRYEPDVDYVVLEDPDGNPFCVVQK